MKLLAYFSSLTWAFAVDSSLSPSRDFIFKWLREKRIATLEEVTLMYQTEGNESFVF